MSVTSQHPQYSKSLTDWATMGDTHSGERTIKEAGQLYLPASSGQIEDGMGSGDSGRAAYDAYKTRSHFPDVVRSAVETMIGIMHHKPPVIELPEALEKMRGSATVHSESLEILLRRINEQQLIMGRLGLLLDVQDGAPVGMPPYIALYNAASILNWDDGASDELTAQNLNLVVLNESEFERVDNFDWEFKTKTRVLVLGDPQTNQPVNQGVYSAAIFSEQHASFSPAELMQPSIAGNTLTEIPFVFVNSKDVVPTPDAPPLLGLARLALTIYRGEADYRQGLFMQGQDTLVVIGVTDDEKKWRVGANATITLPVGGDAKFIGVDGQGLAEMRQALENDKKQASQKGGELLDTTSRERESGDALKIRVAARTATLNQIALAGAFGLETLLKIAARWVGASEDDVSVSPNLDFADDELGSRTLVEWMTAKSLGAPISLRSIHDRMRDKDLTSMTFEEEQAEIEKEDPLGQGNMGDGPVDDDDEMEEDQ